MKGLVVFRDAQQAIWEGFEIYDRTPQGYIIVLKRVAGDQIVLAIALR